MIVTYDWVKEFIPTKLSPEDLAHKLTMIGLEVEGMHKKDKDTVLDINLTPNKADSLSVFGIAREVSLFDDAPLKKTDADISKAANSNLVPNISIEDADLCPRYSGIIVEGIKVEESPSWMKERLENCGIRAINTIVDITNYVLLELGHPLHAFDFDLLGGKKIIVRRAKKGEKIQTLDGNARELSTDMLVIADAEKPVAVAGVMGGANSEINDRTKNILLEAAYFNPVSVRKTSRKLGMHTEASHRFERGADYDCTIKAVLRAAELVLQLNPRAKVSVVKDIYPKKIESRSVSYRNRRYEQIIGIPVAFQSALEIIRRIGAEIRHVDEKAETVEIGIPSYRPDIEHEIDIIEEVARVTGFDKVPVLLPDAAPTPGLYDTFRKEYDAGVALRHLLKGAGLREALNYSFVPFAFCDKMGLIRNAPVRLVNPLDSTQDIMRTELLSGLLLSLQANDRFLNRDLGFFEIGNVFSFSEAKKSEQELKLGLLLCGLKQKKSGNKIEESWDFFDLKGIIEIVLGYFGAEASFVRSKTGFLNKGKSADIIVDGKCIGFLGELDYQKRALLDMKDMNESVFVAELSLADLLSGIGKKILFKHLEKFHPVRRDLSLVVPVSMEYSKVAQSIRSHESVESVDLVDIFKGGNLGPDELSLTFSVKLKNDKDKPLSDTEISSQMAVVVKGLTEGLKLRLR